MQCFWIILKLLSPKRATKGWCTVRKPGVDVDTEPEFASGWGYCSTDPEMEDCNTEISDAMDISVFEVSKLKREFCIEQLMKNLAVEQPGINKSRLLQGLF